MLYGIRLFLFATIMKYYFFSLLVSFGLFTSDVYAQKSYQGILLKNAAGYQKADTLTLLGSRIHASQGQQFLIRSKIGELRYLHGKHIRTIANAEDFWQQLWWDHCSARVIKDETFVQNRKLVWAQDREWLNAFLGAIESETADAFQEDYLQQLVNRIHPARLAQYIGQNKYLTIILLPTERNVPVYYQNGEIVIPPVWLSQFTYEHELVGILARLIANIILEHKVANAMTVNGELYAISPFQPSQTSLSLQVAQDFVKQSGINTEENAANRDAYTRKISSSILLAAREAHADYDYEKAIQYIDRLISAQAASEEAYLLKARIYRRLYNSASSNRTALSFLEKAQTLSTTTNLDILTEQGLLYMRLGEYAKAKTAFLAYDKGLASIGGYDEERRWVKELLFQCKTHLANQ